jgi:outer membrane protein assembly factor BamA
LVVWDIQHIDAFSRLPYQGFWTFGGQTFSGNKALTNQQLEKAIDLKPGERVREGALSDAITGMEQAYDKVFPGQKVKIGGKLKVKAKPVRVATFEWQITEPSTK